MSRTIKQIYRKSRAFDRSCRNGGSCAYCRGNRLHKHNKKLEATLKEVKELHSKVFTDLIIYGKASYSLDTINK